jgi:hypothetical protein
VAIAAHAEATGKSATGTAFLALLIPLFVLVVASSYLRSRKAVHQ